MRTSPGGRTTAQAGVQWWSQEPGSTTLAAMWGRRGCSRRRRREQDGVDVGDGDDGRLGLLQQPLHGLAVGFVAKLPREMEDSRGAQRGHPNPAAPAVDLGEAVLVGSSLGREHLLPQLLGLRYHLQQLLLASILLLLMEPGAGEDGGFAKAPGSRDPAAWVLLLHLSPKLYLA